jgi:hypothetical protein
MPRTGLAHRLRKAFKRRPGRLFLPISVSLLVLFVVAFPRETAGPQPRVVLLGDSITSKWQALAGAEISGLQVINRGVPGDVAAHMLSRFDRDVVVLNPRVVVILGGTNDLLRVPLPAIEHNLESMADKAERNGIRVVLASLPPGGGI